MIRQILFVQGGGKGVHDEWDSKLVASLEQGLGKDYAVRYPRMPGEDDPQYQAWKAALAAEFDSLEDGAILVGHSLGAAILMRALAEQPQKLRFGGLFSVAAPFIGEGGWPSGAPNNRIDFSDCLPPGVPSYFYHGVDDAEAPVNHVRLYEKAFPGAVVRILEGRDHQLNNDISEVARDIRSLR